jgi:exopolyphosphatase/guanosine-5'-triphosphate,3'-diphosphate pyrophosphatase
MKIAVIDLGTNTFNLVIASVTGKHIELLHNAKIGVALGKGGMSEKILTPDAIDRAVAAFDTFDPIWKSFEVEKVIGIGTSAIRSASNGVAFMNSLAEKYGIEMTIIDGQQEAALIFQGVTWTTKIETPSLIMDIGGGSTEFIAVAKNEITKACSLDIGLLRPTQLFQLENPLTKQNCSDILRWFEAQSEPLQAFPKAAVLIGASGSFETFYEMIYEQPFPKTMTAVPLSLEELLPQIDWLIASSQEERTQHNWIIPIRQQLAPIAALKLKWIIEKMNISSILISPCSLKEGVLRVLSEGNKIS